MMIYLMGPLQLLPAVVGEVGDEVGGVVKEGVLPPASCSTGSGVLGTEPFWHTCKIIILVG